mmetsp:Transcript_50702/g.105935  ORF Transcript_50702/g.105935 Transcript_50702/m.105935 type:complete len:111 (+) Transcript_50702:150-482(+)
MLVEGGGIGAERGGRGDDGEGAAEEGAVGGMEERGARGEDGDLVAVVVVEGGVDGGGGSVEGGLDSRVKANGVGLGTEKILEALPADVVGEKKVIESFGFDDSVRKVIGY